MKIVIDLKGAQTETHCSVGSSIGHCESLNTRSERCLMFKQKLKYWKVLGWIKGQYDTDFTKEEIQQLEPRDAAIYEAIEEVLKTS